MRIGGYTIGESLAGHDDVHRGRDAEGVPVLVARFELGEEGIAALRKDAAACRALDHPSVVAPVDVVEFDGGLALVFEDLKGTTLATSLDYLEERNEVLSDGAALKIGGVVAEALHAAHTAKGEGGRIAPLVHAQLGPHQIYLMFDGHVRLLGLGLGTAFRTAAARHEPPEEAKPYVAPECTKGGALTVRANVYGLGVLLWRLLSRRPLSTSAGKLPSLRDLRPDISTRLTSLIDRAVEPSMLKRTVSAFQIAQAIQRSGLADDRDLRWNLELFAELDGFGDDGSVMRSFPPGKLSDVPPSSVQPISSDAFDSLPTQQMDMGPIRERLESLDWSLDEPVEEETSVEEPVPILDRSPRRAPKREAMTTAPSMVAITEETSSADEVADEASEPIADEPRGRAPGGAYLDVPPMPGLTPELEATQKRIARASQFGLPAYHEPDDAPTPRAPTPEAPASEPISEPEPTTRRHGASALDGVTATAAATSTAVEHVPSRPTRSRRPRQQPVPQNALVITPLQVLVGGAAVAALCGGFFAAGFFAGVSQRSDDDRAGPATAVPARSATTGSTTVAVPQPPPPPPPPPPAPTATASASSAASASASAVVQRPPLRPGQGWLAVETEQTHAGVYVNGRLSGAPNQDLAVPCGIRNVRLGSIPLKRWLSPSRAFRLKCGALTTLELELGRATIKR